IPLNQFVKNCTTRRSSDCLEDIAHRWNHRQVFTCLSRGLFLVKSNRLRLDSRSVAYFAAVLRRADTLFRDATCNGSDYLGACVTGLQLACGRARRVPRPLRSRTAKLARSRCAIGRAPRSSSLAEKPRLEHPRTECRPFLESRARCSAKRQRA